MGLWGFTGVYGGRIGVLRGFLGVPLVNGGLNRGFGVFVGFMGFTGFIGGL